MPNTMVAATVRTTQIQLRVKEMTWLFFDVSFAEGAAAAVVAVLPFSLWISGWWLDVRVGSLAALSLT